MITFEIPFNFLLPSFVRVLFDTLHTEHRVGEDVSLGLQDLIDFVTQQACRAPCVLIQQGSISGPRYFSVSLNNFFK